MRLSRAELFVPTGIVAVPTLFNPGKILEVARRCWKCCPKQKFNRVVDGYKLWFPAEPDEFDLNLIRSDSVNLADIRRRLGDISWWMRLLFQHIAMRVNGVEGEGLGRFWESNFKEVRVFDEDAMLACAGYVVLNPIRAALAETLETNDYTSVQRRIAAIALDKK